MQQSPVGGVEDLQGACEDLPAGGVGGYGDDGRHGSCRHSGSVAYGVRSLVGHKRPDPISQTISNARIDGARILCFLNLTQNLPESVAQLFRRQLS